MCGICGAIGFSDSQELVQRMAHAMIHRGPDSEGLLKDGPVALGMRRLKIIDLATGDQPVFNEDRTVAVVFNGEIYNFQELHRELQAAGHRFTTQSDTETIVHAYEEWGIGFLDRLRGMYALAIYDCRSEPPGDRNKSGAILLARDRLGIKPLYISRQGDQLLFASEVRALLASGQIARRVSTAGLYTYLAFGSVQEPLTMVQNITSLPPASWLRLTWPAGNLEVRSGIYWQPPLRSAGNASPEQVRDWLTDAVSSHLISDVPLGAFLSGGMDSGSIVALGSKSLGSPMNTFTLGFDNWSGDERDFAGLTAKRWNAIHQCRLVGEADVLSDLPKAFADMDQPTIDGVNSWYVSREAKRSGLTVALSGVGGDELFAGYRSFRLVPRLKRMPNNLHWLASLPGWQAGWPFLPGSSDMRRKSAAYLSGDTPLTHPYFAVRGIFTQSQIGSLLIHHLDDYENLNNQALQSWQQQVRIQTEMARRYDAIGEVSWLEISQYMLSTLLRDTDMMSMAHSLEVRVPFVDHILVERVLTVSGERKLWGQQPKPMLSAALNGLLPEQVTASPKRTFTFPFESWLRKGLADTVESRLAEYFNEVSSVLQGEAVMAVWRDFESGRTNWARPWALFVLGEWLRHHLA